VTARFCFTVQLPLPPSANNMFINTTRGGRAKSKDYKAWLEQARYQILTAWRADGKPMCPIASPMSLTVRLGITGRARDVSNCIKAIEDALVRELPIPDDRWNYRILILRDESLSGFAVATIEEWAPS
jgi:Holliday junction resolvase RusA-like endonuclease